MAQAHPHFAADERLVLAHQFHGGLLVASSDATHEFGELIGVGHGGLSADVVDPLICTTAARPTSNELSAFQKFLSGQPAKRNELNGPFTMNDQVWVPRGHAFADLCKML